MHVITPTDLKKFQIESYSEMLKNPLSDNHKKYLLNELKRLNENNTDNPNGAWLYVILIAVPFILKTIRESKRSKQKVDYNNDVRNW